MRPKRFILGRHVARAAALAGVGALLSGCGGTPSPERRARPRPSAAVASGSAFESADPTGDAWRLIEVPAASNRPSIVRTPSGWLALSTRSRGDSRAPTGYQSVLYGSSDGVHWRSLPLEPGLDDWMLGSLAYGAGHYVMMGQHLGEGDVIWTSSDAEHWQGQSQQLDSAAYAWGGVVYAGERFFGLGFTLVGVSDTGERWSSALTSNAQPMAVAYGDGHYLLVGSGPAQVSVDGLSWQERNIDCALPGACDLPGGTTRQGFHSHALFVEGRFYIDELSAASDGTDWQSLPGRIPAAYVDGRFLGSIDLRRGLKSWTPDGALETLRVIRPAREAVTAAGRNLDSLGVLDDDAPLPEVVNVEFADGLDCISARCVLIDGRLVLIPPPGTPPLTDRVPRRADGAPLLSDQCPVSSKIFCADYAARSGCECQPEAPYQPSSCADVSQYRCEGAFTAQGDEWQVAEVAQAGCSCDAVDPNQPPSFGKTCTPGGSECRAPLRCLPIELPPLSLPQPEHSVCTSACSSDADCPTWQATGFCAGEVRLRCARGSCQPRSCP